MTAHAYQHGMAYRAHVKPSRPGYPTNWAKSLSKCEPIPRLLSKFGILKGHFRILSGGADWISLQSSAINKRSYRQLESHFSTVEFLRSAAALYLMTTHTTWRNPLEDNVRPPEDELSRSVTVLCVRRPRPRAGALCVRNICAHLPVLLPPF